MPKDHVDRFIEQLDPVVDLDFEVEAIVSRVHGISRRIKREMEKTLAEYGLSHGEWEVLSNLRHGGAPFCSTPGDLAGELELSSGAMTNRIDRLEAAGLVRRRPDPDDRRGVQVELSDEGRTLWESTVSTQARKEALIAGPLTKSEQRQLNNLLRKIMLGLEARGHPGKKPRAAKPA